MRMGVYQPGDNALSSQVDTLCVAPDESQNLARTPDRQDSIASDGKAFGYGKIPIDGNDLSVMQDDVRAGGRQRLQLLGHVDSRLTKSVRYPCRLVLADRTRSLSQTPSRSKFYAGVEGVSIGPDLSEWVTGSPIRLGLPKFAQVAGCVKTSARQGSLETVFRMVLSV
jgi:hypothetical protein